MYKFNPSLHLFLQLEFFQRYSAQSHNRTDVPWNSYVGLQCPISVMNGKTLVFQKSLI